MVQCFHAILVASPANFKVKFTPYCSPKCPYLRADVTRYLRVPVTGPGMGFEPIPHLYEISPLKPWLCILHGDVLGLAILGVSSGILCTIWLFNIAIGKSPFLIGKPSINGPFSMAMLNNQRVYNLRKGS